MKRIVCMAALVAGVAVVSAAQPHTAADSWTVVVGNGPYAGTYHAKADGIVCFHYKAQKMMGASFKDFDAKGARALAQGGINVQNPDVAGAKSGDLNVGFGSADKLTVDYNISRIPITMTAKGKGADFDGAGATKDGIKIHITASCAEVETM